MSDLVEDAVNALRKMLDDMLTLTPSGTHS